MTNATTTIEDRAERDTHAPCPLCKAVPAAECYDWCKVRAGISRTALSFLLEPPQFQHTRTPLMGQQRMALRLMAEARAAGKRCFALAMEQGTGKTLTLLEDAMRLHAAGEIDRVCVIAQNGLQHNWVLSEIPLHVPEDYPLVAAYYASNPTRREREALERVTQTLREVGQVTPLRLLAVNFEALLTDACFKAVESFIRGGSTLVIADESHNIKNMDARRTRRCITLSKFSVQRRASSGTLNTGSPMDAFAQFEFMGPGEELLGTSSLVAFRAEYCELLPPDHGLIRHTLQRKERALGRKLAPHEIERMAPAIIDKDEQGRPKYKNLTQLRTRMAPYLFRCLKADCLDLPPKVFETRYFHLAPAQRRVYDRVYDENRYILEDGTVLTMTRLVAMGKLRQVTSGFLLMRNGEVSYLEDNPRIELLMEDVGDYDRQGIIWSQYREEQRNIVRRLKAAGREVAMVNGDTPTRERQTIREAFQAGDVQWISAHPATMGTGYTLTRAELNIYYSNGFELVPRLQSEDRSHRIGTVNSVLYRDYIAIDTRDDDVVWALQHRLDTAAILNGDPARKSRWAAPPAAAS